MPGTKTNTEKNQARVRMGEWIKRHKWGTTPNLSVTQTGAQLSSLVHTLALIKQKYKTLFYATIPPHLFSFLFSTSFELKRKLEN